MKKIVVHLADCEYQFQVKQIMDNHTEIGNIEPIEKDQKLSIYQVLSWI